MIGFKICHNFESRLVSSKLLRSYSSKFISGDWEKYQTVYCESIETAEVVAHGITFYLLRKVK